MKILLIEAGSPAATPHTATPDSIREDSLVQAGHEIMRAGNPDHARELAEGGRVELVIIDADNFINDRLNILRELRKAFGRRWVPIIFATSNTTEQFLLEHIDAGGDDFLTKPVSPAILTAKVGALGRMARIQSHLERLNAKLQAQSQRDALTELYNRRAFEDLAEKQWRIQTRAREPISVLMIDVDHFKQYNDHYGHQAGDITLASVARVLRSSLRRPADLIARYGGEEFIVLLSSTDYEGTMIVAETLRQAVINLELPHNYSDTHDNITISVGGCAIESSSGMELKELIEVADQALYTAKRNGRNRCDVQHLMPQKTILLVDNDSNALTTISNHLDGQCNLLTTHSGHECIEITHNMQPDLIFIATNLPDMNGATVANQLKNHKNTSRIPLILMMDKGRHYEGNSIKNATAVDGLLTKPVVLEELDSLLEEFI